MNSYLDAQLAASRQALLFAQAGERRLGREARAARRPGDGDQGRTPPAHRRGPWLRWPLAARSRPAAS